MSFAGCNLDQVAIINFDAVGTLFHLARGPGALYGEVAHRHGWSLDPVTLEKAFRAQMKLLPRPVPSPGPRPDDDRLWWQVLVNAVLDQCGAPSNMRARQAYFDELYREFARPEVWTLFPEVLEVLQWLNGRFKLGIISNFDRRLYPVLQGLGLAPFFDYVTISSQVGVDKPDPGIFQEAVARAGVLPAEALHVGDDPLRDWTGAAAAGMKVFELQRPENSLRSLLQ